MNYEIKNNMYQMIKIILDKHNSFTIPAKGNVIINLSIITEQIEDLKNSGHITYKKI